MHPRAGRGGSVGTGQPSRGRVLTGADPPRRVADYREHLTAHLVEHLGPVGGRASVTFLGAEPLEVLRFADAGPDGPVVRYVTSGMGRAPMTDPTAVVADPVRGPRAELVLSLRQPRDGVLRALAVLAATPAVEGLVVRPGATLDLGEPLWPGARVSAVLVGDPGGVVPDLPMEPPAEPVGFLPVLPITATEAAWARGHGAPALRDLWLRHGTDLRDPDRRAVGLS